MNKLVVFFSDRFRDFGRGYGAALVFGLPIWAFVVASRKRSFFVFTGAPDVIVLVLWLTGLFALTNFSGLMNLRIKKLGKEGVEFDYAAQPIPPKEPAEQGASPAAAQTK
jgi:hypothetical protein